MKPPVVSVVLATRNRSHVLPVALRALLRQQGQTPYEVIVVDNGSHDATSDVVNDLRARFEAPMHYVVEPRAGVSHARNSGIAVARASIVAFTDDDVYVDPHWVERIHALDRRHPEIDCFGGKVLPAWQEPPPAWLDRRHWSPLALTDHGDEPFTVSADRPQCLICANLAIRRSTFERIGGFSPDFPRAQDHEWQLRLWRAGGVGLYHPSLLVWANVHPERLTRRFHRRWHLEHGRFSARMLLREYTDRSGRLRAGDLPAFRRWAGVPRSLVRELAKECVMVARHGLSGSSASETLAHLHTACDILGGVAEGARDRWVQARRLTGDAKPQLAIDRDAH
jgi:glycosyltransferase involved in cell wall biosynthesis